MAELIRFLLPNLILLELIRSEDHDRVPKQPAEGLTVNPLVELNLAMILFVPWFSILAALFWMFPRQPRNAARKAFDIVSLVLATTLATFGMQWSVHNAEPGFGHMWQQILSTMMAYGGFLMVMAVAVMVRWIWLSRIPSPLPSPEQET
jgi:hypothetical protein